MRTEMTSGFDEMTFSPETVSAMAPHTFPLYGRNMDLTVVDSDGNDAALAMHKIHLAEAKQDFIESLERAAVRNRNQGWRGGELVCLQTRLPSTRILRLKR